MSASSYWDVNHAAHFGRLHHRRRGRFIGAWSSKYNNRYQFLQVDFGGASKIIRIATQGRHDANQWVTQYYVSHSLTRIHFSEYKERNSRKVIIYLMIIKIIIDQTSNKIWYIILFIPVLYISFFFFQLSSRFFFTNGEECPNGFVEQIVIISIIIFHFISIIILTIIFLISNRNIWFLFVCCLVPVFLW